MQKVASLQILRAVAAMLVVVSHAWTWSKPYASAPTILDRIRIEFMGGLGVDIFFCLSGFIMMWTVTDAAPTLSKGIRFFAKRMQRIYPIYLICLSTIVVPSLIWQHEAIDSARILFLMRNALLLPGLPSEPEYRMLLFPAWTLVYEMYFYLVFAMCVVAIPKRYLAYGLAVALIFIFSVSHLIIGYGPRLAWVNITHIIGDPLILNFLIGSLIAHFGRRFVDTFASAGAKYSAVALSILVCAVGYYVFTGYPRIIKFGIPAMIVVALSCVCSVRRGRLNDALVYLGNASYSIYLTHIFAFELTGRAAALFGGNPFLVFGTIIILATLLGCAVYSLLEKPITQGLKSISARKKPKQDVLLRSA